MQRIDDRVVKKVNELVKDGVTSVAEMERHLGFYVKKELYDGLPLPDPGNRRFFPSRNDIYNIMYTASIQMRHSKIGQEELAHKIAEWQQESPRDKFFLRPSTKSASESFESAQEVLEEDDIMWQMNDADLHADKQSTDLLFVHQTHWQRTLLEKYGNEICLLDATYKTSRYALLYSFCASKLMSITVLLDHLSYSTRPGGQLLKHLMSYVSGTHNGRQDFLWPTSAILKLKQLKKFLTVSFKNAAKN